MMIKLIVFIFITQLSVYIVKCYLTMLQISSASEPECRLVATTFIYLSTIFVADKNVFYAEGTPSGEQPTLKSNLTLQTQLYNYTLARHLVGREYRSIKQFIRH
jgi:hypothetical protein